MPPRTQSKSRTFNRSLSKAIDEPSKTPEKAETKAPDGKEEKKKKSNEDLKKLIESLKTKIGTNKKTDEKKVPPAPKAGWNRSIKKEWNPSPAYTVLTRISNHEKVPSKSSQGNGQSLKQLPHSFLYKPGADGIKVDKLTVKAGKQVGWG